MKSLPLALPVFALSIAFALSALAGSPSFDCAKARFPDEKAICADEQLSRLDVASAAGYGFLKAQRGRPFADQIGVPFYRLRRSCLADVSCIQGVQISAIRAYQQAGAPIEILGAPAGWSSASTPQIGGSENSPTAEVETDFGAPISVPMSKVSGIFTVPVTINGRINLDFVIDSGAADVSIPDDVFSTLLRTNTIAAPDFIGQRTYVLADGSEVPSVQFVIRSLKIGGRVLNDVTGSVGSKKGQLLLGQSFLRRFKSWSIDNEKQALSLN